ncbi:hypothetical protein KS41_24260 [Salmonella enterica]|nr:hypothetical protein [Salmonella enterica]
MTMSDVHNNEFLSIGNFASMSLDPADYHCEPEEADRFMSQTANDLFKKILTQIKQGKICHVAQKTIGLSDYLVVDLHDFRCKYFHLPDDKDLHYPIQISIDVETLESNIFKRAEKYREGVYVWLADDIHLGHTDVKQFNSSYETLEVECYMESEFIGLHVLKHLERKNGEPLLIVFPEFEMKDRGHS